MAGWGRLLLLGTIKLYIVKLDGFSGKLPTFWILRRLEVSRPAISPDPVRQLVDEREEDRRTDAARAKVPGNKKPPPSR